MWKKTTSFFINNASSLWNMVIVAILVLFSALKMNTNDLWWLMALGKHFWQTGQITNYDMLSYTAPGGFFWEHTRLFDILTSGLYLQGGFWSLQIMMLITLLLTYWFFYKTINLKKHHAIVTALIIVFTLNLLVYRILYRPEIFSSLFTAIYLFILFKDKQKNSRLIWLIPFIQMIWANTHAGFVYGLAIVGIFFGGEFLRELIRHRQNILKILRFKRVWKMALVFLASCLAIFLTSYGWHIIKLIIKSLTPQEAASGIMEWRPYTWQNLFNLTDPLSIIVIATLIVLVYKNIFSKKIKSLENITWEEIFLFILYLYSTLQHVRFTYITGFVMAIILARNISQILPKKIIQNQWWIHLLLIIFTANILFSIRNQEFGIGPVNHTEPEQAVNFIKDQKIPGNMINEYSEGGYLSFNLYPEKQVFIDGRTPNLYTNDFFWRYTNLADKNIREEIIKKYNVNFWLLPRWHRLQETLWKDSDWVLIYFDSVSTVYIKNNSENKELIDKFGYKFFKPTADENALKSLCNTDNLQTNPDLKDNLLNDLNRGLTYNPQSWIHLKNIALVYQICDFQTTDLPKIEKYLLTALTINPKNTDMLYQLGYAYLEMEKFDLAADYFQKSGKQTTSLIGLATAQYNLGKYEQALKNLLKAREVGNINDKKYYQTLGRVYYSLNEDQLAIEFYHRYQDFTQDHSAEVYTDLTQAYYYNGQIDKARENLQKALEQDPKYPLALEMQEIMNND